MAGGRGLGECAERGLVPVVVVSCLASVGPLGVGGDRGHADCQVQVSGRTTIKFSGGKLVITKIDKFAHFVLSGQFGGANGQLGPGAPVSFGGGGFSGTFGGTKPVPRSDDPPGLTLRILYVGAGRAIVDLHNV